MIFSTEASGTPCASRPSVPDRLRTLVLGAMGGLTLAACPLSLAEDPRRNATVKAVEKVLPTIVNIQTEILVERGGYYNDLLWDFFGPYYRKRPTRSAYSLGSGVMIDDDGYVLTNAHVIRQADRIEVVLHDGRVFEAQAFAGDNDSDVALLKILSDKPEKFTAVQFAKPDDLLLGETVIALGNPFGLGSSISKGILSSKNRRPEVDGMPLEIADWLQTDAAINPGNSGGPLINAAGQVIGINTAIRTAPGGGLSFAVPINLAKRIAQQIVSTGQASHPFIGVQLMNLTPQLAREINATNSACRVPELNGVLVKEVVKGTPAAAAGIRQCDLILKVENKPVQTPTEVQLAVDRGQVGEPMQLTLQRNGKELIVQVRPRELPRNN